MPAMTIPLSLRASRKGGVAISFSDLWSENVLAKAKLVLRPLVGECVGESQSRSPTSGWRMCWRKPNSFSDLWLENVLAKAKLVLRPLVGECVGESQTLIYMEGILSTPK